MRYIGRYTEALRRMLNKAAMKGGLHFECEICGERFTDFDSVPKHAETAHPRIMKEYDTLGEYKKAVRMGLEKDLRRKEK